MGPIRGPPGTCRPQVGPMLAPYTLLSGLFCQLTMHPRVNHMPVYQWWIPALLLYVESLSSTSFLLVIVFWHWPHAVSVYKWQGSTPREYGHYRPIRNHNNSQKSLKRICIILIVYGKKAKSLIWGSCKIYKRHLINHCLVTWWYRLQVNKSCFILLFLFQIYLYMVDHSVRLFFHGAFL